MKTHGRRYSTGKLDTQIHYYQSHELVPLFWKIIWNWKKKWLICTVWPREITDGNTPPNPLFYTHTATLYLIIGILGKNMCSIIRGRLKHQFRKMADTYKIIQKNKANIKVNYNDIKSTRGNKKLWSRTTGQC